jgi:tRNA (guanosine-2'-O-)-methyltransferase
VVLENVHDPHNIAAVMRTCDAVGVMRIHLVYTIEKIPAKAFARRSSTSAAKWVDTRIHRSIESCYECLRASGFRVLATAGGNPSVSLFEVDFLAPVAIVFGNEMRGLSEEAIALADTTMTIPMAGMVRSLNISVACAVSLYEAFRQRYEHGCYDAPSLSENDIQRMTRDWEQR